MDDQKDGNIQKPTFTGLAVRLGQLPSDKKRVALEMSAAIAGVSLRVSREFVEAVPRAAKILSADDIRRWAEFGRKLAMGSADSGALFFSSGAAPLAAIPGSDRAKFFDLCLRQLVLSSSSALETYNKLPEIAVEVNNKNFLSRVILLAAEVSQRSARHSSELIAHTPQVVAAIERFDDESILVANAVADLAENFALRTGGMTADLWAALPASLAKLDAQNAIVLMRNANEFLEFGGSVTMHFISSGAEVLAVAADSFDAWHGLARKIAAHGNAVLIALLRATPKFYTRLASLRRDEKNDLGRILELTGKIAETDAESALAAFQSSGRALTKVTVEQFETWIEDGMKDDDEISSKARRSYFALETRESNIKLQAAVSGLSLDKVQNILRLYVEALTGRNVEIAPLTAIPQESRIGDGKTIYLPANVEQFKDEEKNFRLYKVLAAHAAGQIEFGTFVRDSDELKAVYSELSSLFESTADQRDAFSLSGYIEDVQNGEWVDPFKTEKKSASKLPKDSDYRTVLSAFPEPSLARRIFSTMENARIDRRLRSTYRGLRKDLDMMQRFLRENRPYIFDLPMYRVPFELLFQITLCGGATNDARQFYGQIVSEIETVVENFITSRILDEVSTATVADSLMATARIYTLFQNISPEQSQESEKNESSDESEFAYDDKEAAESVTEDKVQREKERKQQDVSDLFNAWNQLDEDSDPDEVQGSEAWSQSELPEQPLEADEKAFAYDEWDRDLNDYRVGWSRVIEKKVKLGERTFVELTRSRYKGVISSIRHQFQLMKPENLTRINRELDGEDHDLNALVELVVDRRADGRQSENIYTKKLRRQRDVAVSLLLDQSSSTARTITRNPLQPYTHPGRRIIEIEKEGLVLLSEALEAVGDVYSINGFTSEGRRNVKFYVVKDFSEKYSEVVEKRIGGITFQNNTRLGAAIRHAAGKLLKQESRTKLLIMLTDGRPYDHDYGDARYAREDVREALIEAKSCGIIPFCITIDRESETELKDLYGDVGYTIIDDVLSLPERLPNIYRRLTT